MAADAGATYLLVSPPAYFGASLAGISISEHYHRAADESPIPIIVHSSSPPITSLSLCS